MPENGQPHHSMERIEELVRELEASADPQLRTSAVELVQRLLDMYGDAFRRVLKIVGQSGAAGADILKRFTRDDLVGQLLMLHDLHPVGLEDRVREGLEKVRPLLMAHGGNVSLLGIDEGVVQLKLEGSCHGCPSSTQTLKMAIETALYEAAPDIVALEVAGVSEPGPPSGFVPLTVIAAAPRVTG